MKVLGISGSPRKGATTDLLVGEVLDAVEGADTEFISLAGKNIRPCITPSLRQQPDALAAARKAGKTLGDRLERLRRGHVRGAAM